MFFRYLLIFIAMMLVIRIVRGVLRHLFPPVDTGKMGQDVSSQRKNSQKIDYSDVKDAEFKDL